MPRHTLRSLIRYAGFSADALATNLLRPRTPYKVTFAATYRCSLRCSICRIWERPSGEEIGPREIRELFGRSRFSWVDVTGGEVTERPDILEVFQAVIESSPRLLLLHFPTNGYNTHLALDLVREIRRIGVERLILSVGLDGPEALHNRVRGDGDAWSRAVETFVRLREGRLAEVYFGFTLAPYNLNKVDETVAAAAKAYPGLTARDVHVNFLNRSAHYFGNLETEPCEPEALKRTLRELVHRRGFNLHPTLLMERLYHEGALRFLETGLPPMRCQALSGSLFLDPRGHIYPCHIYSKDLGHVSEFGYDLGKAWREERILSLRREIERFACPRCFTPCEAYQSLLGGIRKWPGLLTGRGA